MIGCLNSDSRLINATVSALSLAYDYDGESVGSLSYSLAQGAAKSFSYQYDENGNIVSEQVTVDGVSADITAYEYDADNQLVSAENSSTKWTYSYDNRGNLTAENEYSVSLNESGEKVYTPKENAADSYTYDTAWKDKLTSYNGQTISYDASGNPTSYLGHNLSWTMGRQLASYDNIAYSYNEIGIRTSKTVGENTTEFYLNGTNIIYQTDGTSDIYFFYDRNNELVGFKYSGNNYFYVKNQMGDITDIADENGNIVASYSYDPWGSVLSVTGSDTAIGNLNPFRYRSYYYDSDIQMYYLQSRYYDPEVGRFINCDDVNYIGIYEYASSYNSFAYCENEPVNKYDPNGLWGYDVHAGYYEKGSKRREFKYGYYIPFLYDGRNKVFYGTYYWARTVGYSRKLAEMIAKASNDIDDIFSPVVVNNFENQSWHFNTNYGVKGRNGKSFTDSRILHKNEMLKEADVAFKDARRCKKNNNRIGFTANMIIGLTALGYALHPVQDMYAHTDDVSRLREYRIPQRVYYKYGLYKTTYTKIYFWEHITTYGVDDPRKRPEQLSKTQTESMNILKKYFNKYSDLFKGDTIL